MRLFPRLDDEQKSCAKLSDIIKSSLLNNLFFHPYTKVQFLIDQLGISRITASKYLNELTEHGFVSKHKVGRTNFYVNDPLVELIRKQEEIEL